MTPTRQRLAHTPYYEAWRTSLRAATDGRGLKTELARFMAEHREQPLHTWRVNIARLLRKDQALGTEGSNSSRSASFQVNLFH